MAPAKAASGECLVQCPLTEMCQSYTHLRLLGSMCHGDTGAGIKACGLPVALGGIVIPPSSLSWALRSDSKSSTNLAE
jgi:hypothetical protein